MAIFRGSKGSTVASGEVVATSAEILDVLNQAVDAKDDAEEAQVAAELAQSNAETAESGAEDAQQAAESAQSSAETAQSNAEDAQSYAEEWANKPEDSLVSTAAGGDGVDDYSALHWSIKSSDSAAAALQSEQNAAQSESNALDSENNAATSASNALDSENKAQDWAIEAEDVEVEPGQFSAFHWAQKAQEFASGTATNISFDDSAVLFTAADVQVAIEKASEAENTSYDGTDSGLASTNVKDAIDEVDSKKAETDIYTATVIGSDGTSDWTGSDPSVATITVSGILSTDVPIVDIDLSGVAFADVEDFQADWALVYRVEASGDNELKLYATEEPTKDFDLTIKVVR